MEEFLRIVLVFGFLFLFYVIMLYIEHKYGMDLVTFMDSTIKSLLFE